MDMTKTVSSKRLAELRLVFPDSQSWCPSRGSDDRPPVFLASQLVLGHANVLYLNDSHYQPGDRLQVSLKGTFNVESWMATNPSHYNWDRKCNTKQILHISRTLPIRSRHLDVSTSSSMYRLTYEFQACNKEIHDIRFGSPNLASQEIATLSNASIRYTCSWSIPSSSTTRFALPGRSKPDDEGYLEVSVKYLLTAVLLREHTREPVAQISRPIIVLDDSHGIQPPTCIADYPDEYRLFTAAVVRSNSMGRNLVTRLSHRQKLPPPRLFVRTSEPSPLVFHHSLQHATTLVPIELTLLGAHSNDQNITNNNVKITWRLQQSRFSAFDGLKKIPTRRLVQKGTSKVSCKTIQESKNTYTCQVGQWRVSPVTKDMLRYDLNAATTLSTERNIGSPMVHSRNDEPCEGWTAFEPSHKSIPKSHDASLDIEHIHVQHVISNAQSDQRPSSLQPPTPPPSPSPPPTIPCTATDSKHGVGVSQKPTHTTEVSLPVSIPLSSFKLPTSTTSYMVTRYTLSIQIRMRFKSSTPDTGKEQHHLRDDDSNSHRKTSSWTAGANLDVPIQLLYAGEDDDVDEQSRSSSSSLSSPSAIQANSMLHNVTSDDELETIREIVVALHHRRAGQNSAGTERSGDVVSSPTSISAPHQEEQEVLPTYGESTSMRHVLTLCPTTSPCD